MYVSIYHLEVVKSDTKIMHYYYTDLEQARWEAKKMADNRRRGMLVNYFTQEISHYDHAATTVHHFDDELTITVYESGWAESDKGKIRCVLGADYTGTTIEESFPTLTSFKAFIHANQPIFV